MSKCSGSDEVSDCTLDAHCRVKLHMNLVSRTVRDALAAVTLKDLCSPAKAGAQYPSPQENRAAAFAGAQG
jgi:DNA-binding IscR family transcriptional regulator